MIMSILHSLGFDYHSIANNLHYDSITSRMIYAHLRDDNEFCYPTIDTIKMFATLEITKSYNYNTINSILSKHSIGSIPAHMNAMQTWIHIHSYNPNDDTLINDGVLDWMIWQFNVSKAMYYEDKYGIITDNDKIQISQLIKNGMPSEMILESVRLLHDEKSDSTCYDYIGAPFI
jgi:hypothetical protein